MKALMKASNQELFKRFQKPPQDIETTMNNIQAKSLSKIIGIDADQIKNYDWFFEQVKKLKLPKQYKRYLNQSKDRVIYFNEETQTQSFEHPSFNIIKIFFYETMINNKNVYTFADKEKKLLPYVEQKMVRQCIGLNSKRRDAQKVNLQRDQNGKMVASKMTRIIPDLKQLLSSRSYMLKMLVEKIFTRKQVLGKGKRANAYMNTINEYNHRKRGSEPDKEEELVETEESLELYQSIFTQSAQFYKQQIGDIDYIPETILNSTEFAKSTPQSILRNIFILNINKESIEMYWLARLMDCLPMPPNWNKKIGSSYDSYVFEPEGLSFDVHPSYIYIIEQMNNFRAAFKNMPSYKQNYYLGMRQMSFYDYFLRLYTVDIYGYIQEEEKKTSQNNKIRLKKIPKEESVVNDWMILQGMHNCVIEVKNYIAIEQIQRFWSGLDFKEEPWCPSISPYGQIIWSSTVNRKSINFCPYQVHLSSAVALKKKIMPDIPQSSLKPQFKQSDEHQQSYHSQIQQERDNFLKYFIIHDSLPIPRPYEIDEQYNQIHFYNQIFISPFNFQQGLLNQGEEVPFWLEKVHAQQNLIENINILKYFPEKYTQIKQKAAKYAIQQAQIHEPQMIDEINQRLIGIASIDELIRFIENITNLDLREERKKQKAQKVVVKDDDDIFGSEISQVDLEEHGESEDEQEKSISEKVQIESENEDIHKIEEVKVQESSSSESADQKENQIDFNAKIVVERPQYSFLDDFKKEFKNKDKINLLFENELNQHLKAEIIKKKKQLKYKNTNANKFIERAEKKIKNLLSPEITLDNAMNKNADENIRQMKRNLLISKLQSQFDPIQNPKQFKIQKIANKKDKNQKKVKKEKKEKYQTQFAYDIEDSYQMFQSQIDLQEQEIQKVQTFKEIQRIKKLKIEEQERRRLQEEALRNVVNPQIQSSIDTNESTILEPIKQIKPQISIDPILKHIKHLSSELIDFKRTFLNKHESTKSSAQLQSLDTKNHETIKTNQIINESNASKLIQNYPKSKSLVKISKNLIQKNKISMMTNTQKIMSKLEKSQSSSKIFNRVCLGHTASHFLQKQAILRKGDLIKLQARKTLISKGRGLQTFISKNY